MKTILLRCSSCGIVNMLPEARAGQGSRCGKSRAILSFPTRPADVTDASFHREAVSHPGLVLADFRTPSCGHCLNLNPVLDQIASEKIGIVKIAKVNVLEEQRLPLQFGIRGVPALTLCRNGVKSMRYPEPHL